MIINIEYDESQKSLIFEVNDEKNEIVYKYMYALNTISNITTLCIFIQNGTELMIKKNTNNFLHITENQVQIKTENAYLSQNGKFELNSLRKKISLLLLEHEYIDFSLVFFASKRMLDNYKIKKYKITEQEIKEQILKLKPKNEGQILTELWNDEVKKYARKQKARELQNTKNKFKKVMQQILENKKPEHQEIESAKLTKDFLEKINEKMDNINQTIKLDELKFVDMNLSTFDNSQDGANFEILKSIPVSPLNNSAMNPFEHIEGTKEQNDMTNSQVNGILDKWQIEKPGEKDLEIDKSINDSQILENHF